MTLNVVNLLATSRFAEYLDLDHFSIEANVDFDPDRFPGLTYKIDNPKVCALIFRSGRIVITGAKTLEDIETALEITHKALKQMDAMFGLLMITLLVMLSSLTIWGEN